MSVILALLIRTNPIGLSSSATEKKGTGFEPPCTICDSKTHGWKECKLKCKVCFLNFCPGSRGLPCVAQDGKIEEATNAQGRILLPFMKEALKARRREMTGKEAESSNVEDDRCVEIEDDDSSDGDVELWADLA